MIYNELQKKVYDNKVRRNFNVTDVGKEIILMNEEFGELCDAYLNNDNTAIADAAGDLMTYCLGLSAMFGWNSDEIKQVTKEIHASLSILTLFIGREVGMLAKTYKKSNKEPAATIDNRENFKNHISNIMAYCESVFTLIKSDATTILASIAQNNENRTHQGQM